MSRKILCLLFVVSLCTAWSCRKRAASALPVTPAAPAAPAPLAPSITLTADRTEIGEGETAKLEWKTENATSVRITELGDVTVNGTAQVSPRLPTTYTATATGAGGSAGDSVRITVTPKPVETAAETPAAPGRTLEEDFRNNVEDVLFDYDRYSIRPSETSKLDRLARWLSDNPQARIVIEGHADERGNEEYNIGLGDARASSVRMYLEGAGIQLQRVETVSYGEERPVCRDQSENCWSRNRRVHFLLASTS